MPPTTEATPTPPLVTPPTDPAPAPAPQPDGAKPAEAKPAETPPAAEPVEPLTAESIKLPEGLEPDEAGMTKFLELMNDGDMKPGDRAQGLIDMMSETLQTAAEAQAQAFNDLQETWREEAKALPEIGGDKLPATLEAVNGMVRDMLPNQEQYQAFSEAMVVTGFGNHPMAVQFLHNVAARLAEPTPAAAGGSTQSKSGLESMYPTMAKGN